MLPVAFGLKSQDDDDNQNTQNEIVEAIPNKCCKPEII